MKENIGSSSTNQGVPVAVSIGPALRAEGIEKPHSLNVRRMIFICLLAVLNALLFYPW